MINLKNAKEFKKKVEEIKNKRKVKGENIIKVSKKETKKDKEKKKKFRSFLFKLFAVEYLTVGAILLYCYGAMIIQENQKLTAELLKQNEVVQNLSEQVTELRTKPMAVKTISEEVKKESKVYLGNFKITHYCACTKCCGPNAQGITASGKRVEANKTIAVDPSVIKLGSKVYIDGYGYMEAQDTGSAIKGNIIDVYVEDHQEALMMGVQYKDVFLVK